ncbi:MAG: DEAD/DEAH box helicase [Acidimicrobiales bacterium]
MTTTFAHLGVPPEISDALARRGITEPFEIQSATIADGLARRDICGRAPTGSGKTLAFGIPLVAGMAKAQPGRPHGLVLAPTRELAEQISRELQSFSGKVRVGVAYGGVGYGPQLKSLRKGIEILVACPGRLEDLIEQGAVDLGAVDRVVLDEADRMADMGFMPAVRRLLDQTQAERQTVLFSATLDGDVARLTRDYQVDPVTHEVGETTPDITSASHVFWNVDRSDRVDVAAEAINAVWPAIVFCRTRHGSDRLAKQLRQRGIEAAAIHGGRSQGQRNRALADFTNGRIHALVATDVAARGIHVDGVASVVHVDPPEDHKAYVHRSGRTARAGEGGVVLSLVLPDQVKGSRRLQRTVGISADITDPDAGALRDLSPTPIAPRPKSASSSDGTESSRDEGRPSQSASTKQRSQGKKRSHNKKRTTAKSSSAKPRNNGAKAASGQPKSSRSGSGKKRRHSSSTKVSASKRSRSSSGNGSGSGNKRGSGSSTQSRGGSGSSTTARPNRKARRAHLQPGARTS